MPILAAEVAGGIITSDMLTPITTGVTNALPLIAGAGIAIMVPVLCFKFIPKVIKMFAK